MCVSLPNIGSALWSVILCHSLHHLDLRQSTAGDIRAVQTANWCEYGNPLEILELNLISLNTHFSHVNSILDSYVYFAPVYIVEPLTRLLLLEPALTVSITQCDGFYKTNISTQGIIAGFMQSFYAWRVHRLINNIWVTSIIGFGAVAGTRKPSYLRLLRSSSSELILRGSVWDWKCCCKRHPPTIRPVAE